MRASYVFCFAVFCGNASVRLESKFLRINEIEKLRFRTSALLYFYAAAVASFLFCNNKSTTNEFKRLLLTEEAHVRIKPRNSSTRPNKASRKNIHCPFGQLSGYLYKHVVFCIFYESFYILAHEPFEISQFKKKRVRLPYRNRTVLYENLRNNL